MNPRQDTLTKIIQNLLTPENNLSRAQLVAEMERTGIRAYPGEVELAVQVDEILKEMWEEGSLVEVRREVDEVPKLFYDKD